SSYQNKPGQNWSCPNQYQRYIAYPKFLLVQCRANYQFANGLAIDSLRKPGQTDRFALHYRISTSAGAMMERPLLSGSGGKSALATRQPRWRNRPRSGGRPVTLPISLIAAGSKPGSTVTDSPSSEAITGSSAR